MPLRFTVTVFLFVAAFGARFGRGQDAAAPLTGEEKAILAADRAFVQAYNAGDAGSAAALFTEDAEIVEADGRSLRGRDSLRRSFTEGFERNKGTRIHLDVDSIRVLTPDSVREHGSSTLTPPKGPPVTRSYTALYVRRDDRWRIAEWQGGLERPFTPHERLEALDWLIGEWLDEGAAADARLDCRWSDDGNFLLRTIRVHHRGKLALSVVERIGWDPLARQFRSWDFDSEGGYGEGRWTRDGDGDRWIVKHSGVGPDGAVTSSTNFMTRERPDLVRCASTDRVAGDRLESDGPSYVFVRVPLRPGAAGRDDSRETPPGADSERGRR